MSVILPHPADREAVVGFWVSLTLLTGAMIVALLAVFGSLSGLTALIVSVLGLGSLIAGLSRERWIHRVYMLWNRVARKYARRASQAVLAIWYYSVFAIVSRAGGSTLEKAGSDWLQRETLQAQAYAGLGGAQPNGPPAGTLRDYCAWALRSRQLWLLFLLPLFLLLVALDPKGSRAAASDIYTLY